MPQRKDKQSETRNAQIAAVVTATQHAAFARAARRKGLSVSSLARRELMPTIIDEMAADTAEDPAAVGQTQGAA